MMPPCNWDEKAGYSFSPLTMFKFLNFIKVYRDNTVDNLAKHSDDFDLLCSSNPHFNQLSMFVMSFKKNLAALFQLKGD